MAYCVNCGSELPKNAKFCFECGAKLTPPSQVQKEQNKTKPPIPFDEIDDSFDYVEESVAAIPTSVKADKSEEVKEAAKESVSDNSSALEEQTIPDESYEPVDTDETKTYDEPAIPVSQEEQAVSVEPVETEVLGESEGLHAADEMDELEEKEDEDEKTDTGAEKLSFSDLSTYESTSHSDFREDRNMKTQEQPVYVTSPDADPYWDDVLPEIDNEIYQIPKDIFLKAIGIIVGLIAIMAWLIYWIPQF